MKTEHTGAYGITMGESVERKDKSSGQVPILGRRGRFESGQTEMEIAKRKQRPTSQRKIASRRRESSIVSKTVDRSNRLMKELLDLAGKRSLVTLRE